MGEDWSAKTLGLSPVNKIRMTSQFMMFRNLAGGALGVGGLALFYTLETKVKANTGSHWPSWGFSHQGTFDTIDKASARRGFEVYLNVCKACHGIKHMPIRRLIGVTHTKDELKAQIQGIMVTDGPNGEGEMFQRQMKPGDTLPDPYENDGLAKAANNGALPPDLSLITLARKGGEDYLFSLLTGYQEPPAGVKLEEGQYYNPYFLGGVLGMPPPLYNGVMEYSDGTPATISQMSKDVITFLAFTSDPNFDERKNMFPKAMAVVLFLTAATYYMKRRIWVPHWTRKVTYYTPKSSGRKG